MIRDCESFTNFVSSSTNYPLEQVPGGDAPAPDGEVPGQAVSPAAGGQLLTVQRGQVRHRLGVNQT